MEHHPLVTTHESDEFRTNRIIAIQPKITLSELGQEVMQTEDPTAISFAANLIRLWALQRRDFPADFVDEVTLTQLSRQPVSLFEIHLEFIQRELQSVTEPFEGGRIDSTKFATSDVFELLPVSVARFPTSVETSVDRLSGGEQVSGCVRCNSAGAVDCTQCEGGQMACPQCHGSRRVECERCLGAGSHIGASGNLINCVLCGTRGYKRCVGCQSGTVDCTTCYGRGLVTCGTCDGQGNMLTYWQLRTEISSRSSQFSCSPETWPIDMTKLMGDTTQIHVEQWTWPAKNSPKTSYNSWIPENILHSAQTAIEDRLRHELATLRSGQKISAIKVRLLGVYAYSIDYRYKDADNRVYVSGLSNRVFSERGATPRKGLLGGLKKLSYHVLNSLIDHTPPVDRAYLTAVRSGSVHIGDTRRIVPEAAKMLPVNLEISEQGYRLTAKSDPSIYIDIGFELTLKNQPLLSISRLLGHAERQAFQQALQLNNRLSFGRVTIEASEATESFVLVERRLYKFVTAKQLSKVLRAMISESQTVIAKNLLR